MNINRVHAADVNKAIGEIGDALFRDAAIGYKRPIYKKLG